MSIDLMSRPSAGNSNSDDLSDAAASGENDLRDLIYQSLERDGLISRLKAQLRAAVFTTIEKASSPSATTSNPHTLAHEGVNGQLARAIVLDWLTCSHLSYTEDVLKVETSGPQYQPALTRHELIEQLPIKLGFHEGQPILHSLLNQLHRDRIDRHDTLVENLPQNVKESIDGLFARDRTIESDRLRQHFHSLFSANFELSILDAYLEKNLSSSSLTQPAYEDLCSNWMKSCAKSLQPLIRTFPSAQPANTITIHPRQVSTQLVKSASNDTSSSSSSSSSSSDEKLKQTAIKNPTPIQTNSNKSLVKKSTDLPPPQLIDFGENDDDDEDDKDDDDDEEDTSASIFSKRNATPAALDRLKQIEKITQGDETPRTRTNVDKFSTATLRNVPVEYDDESFSQSHSILSSVDDVTVDRTSSSPTGPHADYIEDF